MIAVLAVYAGISVVALSALPVIHHGVGYSAELKQTFSAPGYATALGHFYENDPVLGVISRLGLHGTVLRLSRILRRHPRRDDPVHRDERGHDRDLAPVVVAVRAPPAAAAVLAAAPALPHPVVHAHLLLGARGRADPLRRTPTVLGNLYSFGAMLSFTTAHAAIVALRVKDPDRERPYSSPWGVRINGYVIPMTAVIGGIGTVGAWVRRRRCSTARPGSSASPGWSLGMAGYFLLPQRQRAWTRAAPTGCRVPSARRTSRSSSTRPRSCRSSATTSAHRRCAARPS